MLLEVTMARTFLILALAIPLMAAQTGNDWPAYGRDAGGSRFSPLRQINRDNVSQLKIAWTYRTGAADIKAVSSGNAAFESTPILVDGLLYLTTPYSRVIALDPATGTERWTFDPQGCRVWITQPRGLIRNSGWAGLHCGRNG